MFEMKNELDETATKHKNEDFFKKLDADRTAKNCEFAVLVSLLEPDSELYNTGIVDVSYRYSSSVNLVLQDMQDRPMSEFNADATRFIAKLNERPEIMMAMSTYSERFPKYEVSVDAAQCDRAGVSPATVLNTLGAYCGGAYVGNFNQFGKVYRIMANAAPEYRLDPSSLNNIFVRVRGGKMSPISEFVTLKEIVGSASVDHFNLFQSITCGVMSASGYSEGDAHQAIAEVFKETMPTGYSYEYGGMSREVEEAAGSNATALIYVICAILIYLILASLYNSWFTPWEGDGALRHRLAQCAAGLGGGRGELAGGPGF